MINTHEIFKSFNQAIRLSDKDRETLKIARNSLRERVIGGFKRLPEEERKTHTLEFQSQGSFIMDTIIKPYNDDFDLDDGVYFQGGLPEQKRSETKQFHELIIKAIDKNNDIEEIIDKPTCVRTKYYKKNGEELGFHIDIPIYYAENMETPELADTKKGWIISNPVEFIAWFEEKTKSGFEKAFLYESIKYAEPYEKWLSDLKKADCQLRRVVRYLKAWGDNKKDEMPPGIVMTILAGQNFRENASDDVALRDTLLAIKTWLTNNNYTCPRPTTPKNEDLFKNMNEKDKNFFINALDSFINSAVKATSTQNQIEACKEWKKHFGHRFPCHLATDNITKKPNLDALKRTAAVATPWQPKN